MPGITIQIQGDGAGAAEALRVIEERMKHTEEKGAQMGEQLAHAGERVRSALEMAGIGIGVREVADRFKELIETSVETAVQLKHMSEQTGISTENLSTLRYVSDQTGISFESLSKGFKKLSTDLWELTNGGAGAGQVKAAFQTINVSEKELAATGGDLFKVMELVAEHFKTMPDGFQKNAVATQLFGRAGQELIPVLNDGAEGIEKFRSEADALGLVLDEKGVNKLEELHRSISQMKGAFAGLGLEITSSLAPALEQMARDLSGLIAMSRTSATQTAKGLYGAVLQNIFGDAGPGMQIQEDAARKLLELQKASAKTGGENKPTGRELAPDLGGGGQGEAALNEQDVTLARIEAKWQQAYHLTAGILAHYKEMVADAKELDKIEGAKAWDKMQADAQARVDATFHAQAPDVRLQTETSDPLGAAKGPGASQMGAEASIQAISGFMDGFAEQAARGKMNFRSLVDSAIADLARWAMHVIEMKSIIPALNALFGVTPGMGFDEGGSATFNGAPISSYAMAGGGELGGNGDWAIVGDSPSGDMRNAELFAPKGPGSVLPHDVLEGIAKGGGGGGGGSPSVTIHNTNNASQPVNMRQSGVSYDADLRQFVIHTVLEDASSGGPTSIAFGRG